MIKRKDNGFKVSIIGAGFVGSSIAYALMLRKLASEIVLIDKNTSTAIAEKLDLNCDFLSTYDCHIHEGDYSSISNSDIIIVTCGRSRKPNETRLDMITDNIKIAENVAIEIKKYYDSGVILIVSNPVDIITYKMTKWFNLPKGKVFGTGCILDSSRFVNVLTDYIGRENCSRISATVIGEHGESQVPVWSSVKIDDVKIDDYCKSRCINLNDEIKNKLAKQVTTMGTDIIKGKGRTNFGIATCVSYIVDYIKNDKKCIISVSSLLNGEYGLSDLSLSLPCSIGKNGVERVYVNDINDKEKILLKDSSNIIKDILSNM